MAGLTPSRAAPFDDPAGFLRGLFQTAVQYALPAHRMAPALPPPPRGRTLVLGAGKAAGAMVHALEALWPQDAALSGLVVTRYGHTPPRTPGVPARVEIVEAAHPVPDAAGLRAAEQMLALAHGLTADDLVLCLISGGGSSLLTLPCEGLTLEDKQALNRALLHSGANITEMNCVRKHLSRIKGGRLAAACAPAQVVTLAISDVPGDDPAVIASGPTVPDNTTCADALAILDRYGIPLPESVEAALRRGDLETPKSTDARRDEYPVHLLATPWQSLQAAAEKARAAGLAVHMLGDAIEGESREVGRMHGAMARAIAQGRSSLQRPCVLLSGGETTVTVAASVPSGKRGRGGRAGEFCMGVAEALQGQPGVWALAADTDGIDGMEDNAGATVGPNTLASAFARGLSLADHQQRNDAYGFFAALNDLVVTGPTHTNVNDFRALLVL